MSDTEFQFGHVHATLLLLRDAVMDSGLPGHGIAQDIRPDCQGASYKFKLITALLNIDKRMFGLSTLDFSCLQQFTVNISN